MNINKKISFETKNSPFNSETQKIHGGLRTKDHFKVSYPDKPLVSIITIVLNGENYLEETIKSVLNQSYGNIEYIIIDGGSTDKSLEIIKKYEDKIDYWISEKDNGVSDAFNRGIKCAFGEIVGIINSDDWYELETITEVVKIFALYPKTQVLCGAILLHDKKFSRKIYSEPSKLWMGMTITHPATFVKLEVYKSFGLFDTNFKYAMDFDLIFRLYNLRISMKNSRLIFANMRSGGLADKNKIAGIKEIISISKKYRFTSFMRFRHYLKKLKLEFINFLRTLHLSKLFR